MTSRCKHKKLESEAERPGEDEEQIGRELSLGTFATVAQVPVKLVTEDEVLRTAAAGGVQWQQGCWQLTIA